MITLARDASSKIVVSQFPTIADSSPERTRAISLDPVLAPAVSSGRLGAIAADGSTGPESQPARNPKIRHATAPARLVASSTMTDNLSEGSEGMRRWDEGPRPGDGPAD